ncbi:unnamed protein product [Knipowitschia caucasica]
MVLWKLAWWTPGAQRETQNEEVSKLIDSTCLTPQQQSELRSLLEKWMKVFASDEEDFGRTHLVQHRIHTGESRRT